MLSKRIKQGKTLCNYKRRVLESKIEQRKLIKSKLK